MNCLEFRRRLNTDPGSQEPEFLAHMRQCPHCQLAVAKAAHFEQRLRDGLRVEVPEKLTSRILLRQAFRARTGRRIWQRPVLAAAAGVVLMLAGVLAYVSIERGPGLEQEVVALIRAAPYALAAEELVSDAAVAAILRPVGVQLDGDLGPITFAGRCYVRGKMAGHLVLKGETARITVFLIPHEQIAAPARIREGHLSGRLLPAGAGTIAIVSAPGEALGAVEGRLRSAVRWPA